MNIQKYIQEYKQLRNSSDGTNLKTRLPRIFCNDGFSLSVQVGKLVYSSPRNDADVYESVEIGFPSEMEELINPFVEGYTIEDSNTNYLGAVYPYVPIEIVDAVITKHGGIDLNKTMEEFSEN